MRQDGDPLGWQPFGQQPGLPLKGVHDQPVEAAQRFRYAVSLHTRSRIAVERVGIVNGQHERRSPAEACQEATVEGGQG